ncbi:hypothetical protein GGF42_000982 [Coemansia sp. RSA 2424]|nr:hypothetical protein GGF42_000982 [Coemansia sp. RSA 2424]
MRWAGDMISAATDLNQVIIAITDAMITLNAAYDKCKILHGNISDRAILIRETADGVTVVLTELDYATCADPRAGTANCEPPELVMFRPILSLVRPDLPRTILDAFESLLYVICYLGTCGVTQAERAAFDEATLLDLPIKLWSAGTTKNMSDAKHSHMDSMATFRSSIASYMHPGPLCDLAISLHRTLFLNPKCPGACVRDATPPEAVECDPLIYHNTFRNCIVERLLCILASHRRTAANALAAEHGVLAKPVSDSEYEAVRAAVETLARACREAEEAEHRAAMQLNEARAHRVEAQLQQQVTAQIVTVLELRAAHVPRH